MAWQFLQDWQGYRAFQRIPRPQRRIVFLAESRQDWHHFEPVIRYLTGALGEHVIYVTSDPDDRGLQQVSPRMRGFCIGRGLFRIWFCQFLDADVLVTQILDLGNLDLKRSVNRVHYVYMFHSLISTHMADHANSFDHYDTILCAAPHQLQEIRRREQLHGLPPKQLLPHGYARLEQLMATRREPPPVRADADIHVLLAPSWGEQTILPVCGPELVRALLAAGFRVTLRPHYQTRWMTPQLIDRIVAEHAGNARLRLVEQMGESDSLFDSHVMITDWSGAGHDYGMGLEKPVLYIDLPPKSRNDSWPELGIEPFEMSVRSRLGGLLPPQRVAEAPALVRELVADPGRFRQEVSALRARHVFNLGSSGSAGAEAIARIARDVSPARGPDGEAPR
jgi:YidC/Oxa1 family membrane protein insertase